MIKNKSLKHFIASICIVLSLCIGLTVSVQMFAQSQQEVRYLSDIKLFYADEDDDNSVKHAREKCEKEGYTLLPVDLNSGTSEDYVYLAYKTTTNPDMAITDIRMLGMDRDYSLYDYNEILKYLKNSHVGTAQTLVKSAEQFTKNYKAGSPKALTAYKGLNLFYVDSAKMKFGDYLLEGKANLDFFTTLVVKASSGTMNAVMNYLNLGIAPYFDPETAESEEPETEPATEPETEPETEPVTEEFAFEETYADGTEEDATYEEIDAYDMEDVEATSEETQAEDMAAVEALLEEIDDSAPQAPAENWAAAFVQSPMITLVNSNLTADERNALHRLYNDGARELFKRIQEFTTSYENALARNESDEEAEDSVDPGDIQNASDAVEEMDNLDVEDSDFIYLAAYEMLSDYRYNENTTLGEWLLEMGMQTSDEVDLLQLYPLVDVMGDAQVGLINALGFTAAVTNLSENTSSDELDSLLPEIEKAIYDYNRSNSISIWDTADDDMDDAHIAYTSDAVRKSNANNTIGKKTRFEIIDEKIQNVLMWINLGVGAATVVTYTLSLAVTGAQAAFGCFAASSAACASMSAFCVNALAVISYLSAACFWVGLAVLAFSIGYMIGKWIGSLIKDEIPTLNHSTFPDFVFDVAENGKESTTVKYTSIKDENGKIGDLNARGQKKWLIMCTTKNTAVGSPIRTDETGSIFKVVYGNAAVQNGYDCVSFFGERNPGNANTYTKDKVHGIYISYRSEASLLEAVPSTPETEKTDDTKKSEEKVVETQAKNYLADIIVETGDSLDEAKAKINRKAGKYYIYDYNLSPGTGIYTYIGYTMTTDPDKAITDIRVAPYHGSDDLVYGEATYKYVGHLGIKKEVGDTSIDIVGDALMKTDDESAGSPIPADGLRFVTSHKKAEPGWEPVTLFCGLPYNFNTKYENLKSAVVSGYSTTSSNNWGKHKDVYLYFEPSKKYVGGEKYLAGVYFINGYKIQKTFSYLWTQTKANMDQLKDKIREYPMATVYDVNLAGSADMDMESGHDRLREFICYAYTYNPKRAIYDIALYQGDTYNNSLNYSLSKPSAETGRDIHYAACSAICQQGVDMSNISKMPASRFISMDNAFINSKGLLVMREDYDELVDGYTKTLPENVNFSYSKANFLPMGMYVAGNTVGKEPLKMSDVILSRNSHTATESNGKLLFDVSGEKTLAGTAAEGAFHAVYELKNPHSTKPVDIAYPVWYDDDDDKSGQDSPVYVYIRGSKSTPQKYVASLTVGSFSRAQYKSSLESKKSSVSDDEVEKADSIVNSAAMSSATSGCTDEVIMTNLCLSSGDAWYGRQKSGKANPSAPENKPAAYIGISRTDKASAAITGVLLYQIDDTVGPNRITCQGVDYICAGSSAPIQMNGKNYFLYYTYNTGVSAGRPIENITADNKALIPGAATNLCFDKDHDTPYGNPDQPNFIHIQYTVSGDSFFDKLYLGKGATKNEALCQLLSQECNDTVDIDLNRNARGEWIVLGYRRAYIDKAALEKKTTQAAKEKELEKQTQEAIYDIVVTRNQPYHPEGIISKGIYYYPVGNVDLNAGTNGETLYMYYASNYLSSWYNKNYNANTKLPQEKFSSYISHIAFASDDRVPYKKQISSKSWMNMDSIDGSMVGWFGGVTQTSGSDIVPWEYVLYSDDNGHVNVNEGVVTIEGDHAKDRRLTMFAQRNNGSVKPAGEITGGFTEKSYEYGVLSFDNFRY